MARPKAQRSKSRPKSRSPLRSKSRPKKTPAKKKSVKKVAKRPTKSVAQRVKRAVKKAARKVAKIVKKPAAKAPKPAANEDLNLLHELMSLAKKAGADTADALLVRGVQVAVGQRLGEREKLERSEGHEPHGPRAAEHPGQHAGRARAARRPGVG